MGERTSDQARFAAALLDRSRRAPTGLAAPDGADLERRFAIHHGNVRMGLIGALASRFPAAERVVGADFFAAMARIFIEDNPPRSPLLFRYGDDLAEFVEAFAPAASVPYLPDLIRLEAARGAAYHAVDEAALGPDAFAHLPPDRLADLHFTLHPAAAIVRSPHPIVTLWAMNAGEADLAPIEPWVGEDALVTRPRLSVQVRRLPEGGAAFLSALVAGRALGDAVEEALAASPAFDLASNIAGIIEARVVTAIR